jgi:hypothetical protein
MNDPDVLNKMADIELPAPPDWRPVIIIGITSLIVLVAILRMWYSRRRIQKRHNPHTDIMQSGRVLEEIKNLWSAGRISDREASYRLTTLLRLELGLAQLPVTCPAELANDSTDWESTIQLFNQLRYKKTATMKLSAEEFNFVKRLLKHSGDAGRQPC